MPITVDDLLQLIIDPADPHRNMKGITRILIATGADNWILRPPGKLPLAITVLPDGDSSTMKVQTTDNTIAEILAETETVDDWPARAVNKKTRLKLEPPYTAFRFYVTASSGQGKVIG